MFEDFFRTRRMVATTMSFITVVGGGGKVKAREISGLKRTKVFLDAGVAGRGAARHLFSCNSRTYKYTQCVYVKGLSSDKSVSAVRLTDHLMPEKHNHIVNQRSHPLLC